MSRSVKRELWSNSEVLEDENIKPMPETIPFEHSSVALSLAILGSLTEVPKILLAATDRWYPTARFGVALENAGCRVEAVCPSDHPLALTQVRRQL